MRPSFAARFAVLVLASLAAIPAFAVIRPVDPSALQQKAFRHPGLEGATDYRRLDQVSGDLAARLGSDLAALGVPASSGVYDLHTGRWVTLIPSRPLIPGSGVGNNLRWQDLGRAEPGSTEEIQGAAWSALAGFVSGHGNELRIALDELEPRVTVHDGGRVVQIVARRVYHGIEVRDTYVTAVINNGNLVLLGARNWGDLAIATTPTLDRSAALGKVWTHLGVVSSESPWRKPYLAIVPFAGASSPAAGGFRLVWVLSPKFRGDHGSWEALVDAHTGELLAFEDTNHYATARKVSGGVLPITNDEQAPDGVEQASWPTPFADVTDALGNTYVTDSGGNLPICLDGNITTHLDSQFVRILDQCIPTGGTTTVNNNVGSDNIDLGTAPPFGTDCTPSSNPALGNTRASRTGFYEVNRIIEQARGHLPDNLWLQDQLTANMNIPNVCNAFWNGSTINFYRNAAACTNTGEIAAIFDHEWGHGMDNFDANGVIARPGQEGIADAYMFVRLNTSCVGRNFSTALGCNSPARGYGDPCNNDCDGVRDIDYHNRTSQAPHGMAFLLSNCGATIGPTCGGSVHCVGAAVSEAIFDMARRDLRCHGVPGGWVDTPLHNGPVEGGQCAGGAPPTMDYPTAYELTTRLFYLGAGPVGRWFECRTDGTAGCIADGGYLNQLAADDDNGNLSDGTPHMKAIHAAHDRRQIDCDAFPTVQNSGCAGAPTAAPIVTATALDRAVRLTWPTVPNALSYDVFRTEGVFQCDFGKTKIGQIPAGDCAGGNCEFVAEELQNGFTYYFTVLPLGGSSGPANTCTGVMSACTTATPVSGSNLSVNESSAALSMVSGDGDIFLDNCENAGVTFPVFNIGSVTQTNVRIVSVAPTSHPAMTVTTTFPAPVAATLATCATAPGSFQFTAFGAAFQDDVEFVVEITSDQLAAQGVTRKFTLRFAGIAEGDFQPQASKVFDFESNLESWQVVSGTFNRTTANPPGGAGGSSAFVASSSNLPSQCDQIRSPLIRLKPTSTLSLFNQFETEGDGGTGTWYDRANVGIVDFANGDRTVVSPDGGRGYNVPNGAANGTCGTQGQPGWAGTHAGFGTAAGWAASNFSAGALGSASIAGDVVQIGINYGTDPGTHLSGFWFDRAQLTDFDLHVPDAQSCGVNLPPDAVDDAAATFRNTAVAVNVLANDSDPEGDTLAITAVQSPTAQGGTAIVNGNGTPGTADDFIDYTPPAGFLSPPDDTFTYTIGDGQGHFDSATVRVTVAFRNNPPDAVNDSASTLQNTPVAIDVLANDSDPDGQTLAITSVQSPTARGGTAAVNGNGTPGTADDFVDYTPPAGFFSPPPDSFIYTISDGTDSATATVSVTVMAPCPPQPTGTFSDDVETVVAGYQTQSTRTDPPPSSWRRFSPDPSASSPDTVWQALDDQPGNPTLTPIDHRLVLPPLDLSATSQLSFKHNFDFARFPAATLATSFQSGSAIEISADGGASWVDIGNFITTGGYNGVVDADASANTNPLRGRPAWVGTSNPATPGDPRIGPNGRLEPMTANPVQVNLGAAIQTLFSTPHLLDARIRFRLGGTFQALGGGVQGTGWGVDDIVVTGLLEEANCPPVAVDDSATTSQNTPVTVNVVTNDSDPNGDPLTVTSVTDPPHGSAVNNGNGTVTYTPDSGFVGSDSFGYTVCDDGTPPLCDTATVAITVTAPLLPDLVVSNITVNNNRNVREGDKVTIRATISNTGNASAPASTTEFRLDNTTILGSVATPTIPAGSTREVSVQWDTRSQKGQHTIRVTADAGNPQTVTESNENNNTSTLSVNVQGNKVKNSSFEQGGGSSQGASTMSASAPGPAAWSGESTGAGSATWSDGGSDGAKSAGATGNGGNAATAGSPSWTSDAIAVTPGEALSFLVSVSSANASSAATAGLVYLGAAGNVLQTINLITAPLTTAGFAKLEQAVTIPAGVTQVRVKLVGFSPADLRTSGTVKFDEVGLFGD